MTTKDKILQTVSDKSGLTELEIATCIFGSEAVQQRVNPFCRELLKEGVVVRSGRGGPGDPFTYTIRK